MALLVLRGSHDEQTCFLERNVRHCGLPSRNSASFPNTVTSPECRITTIKKLRASDALNYIICATKSTVQLESSCPRKIHCLFYKKWIVAKVQTSFIISHCRAKNWLQDPHGDTAQQLEDLNAVFFGQKYCTSFTIATKLCPFSPSTNVKDKS